MGLNAPTSRAPRTAGFTLVEIMAVVLIILVLAGLILSMAGHATKEADISSTKALLGRIALGLEAYKSEVGDYPCRNTNTVDATVPDSEMYRVLYRTLSNTQHATYNKVVVAGREPFMDWKPTELNPVEYYPWDTPKYVFQTNAGFVDAWGNAVQYSYDPAFTSTYRLYSMGPDGKSGDATQRTDDITP